MPVGLTAKVRSLEAAQTLSARLTEVAAEFDVSVRVIQSYGSQPVGRGIGPALEARDVLATLQRAPDAPGDLRQRAFTLAGVLLELGGPAAAGQGRSVAEQTIEDGRAWTKFERICEAQGGMREPPVAALRRPILAPRHGPLNAIDNRKIAKLAKLAGAPDAKAAGVEMHVRVGDLVGAGQPLCTVHAQSPGELDYAFAFASRHTDIFEVGEP